MDRVIILSQTATNKEYDRILSLRRHLQADLCELLVDDYKAVAIHSNSIVIAANEYCAEMFGYTVDEAIGLNSWTLFAASSAEVLTKHLMSKSEAAYQVIARRKDGGLFKVELKGKDSELAGEPIRTVLLKEAG